MLRSPSPKGDPLGLFARLEGEKRGAAARPSNSSWAAPSKDGSAENSVGVDVLYREMLGNSKERPSDVKLDCQTPRKQRDVAGMRTPHKQPQDDEQDRQHILLGTAELLGTTRSMVDLCSVE